MAGKARYLIFFQYCGTRYSGVMKSPSHQPILGVQNYLENAVQKLRPVNEVDISISSRTDSGVHALCNSAHLDIQRKEGKPPFSAELLVDALNFHLKPEPIRALSRTYVYRLVTGCWHRSQLPVFERNLCWPVHNIPLNVDIMKEAAQILLGTHDFSTFRSLNSETPFKSPLKTLLQVDIIPGFSISLQQDFHSHLKFWELTFKSRSFLYKQVRRMTGALVAVGQGKLMPRHIADLLEMRDSRAYPPNIIAPPDGLFLKNVEYNTKDLEVEESVIQ
ncbi:tRNA pseudouridine synthase-like 1 isoform X2 [Stegostoma tigrinum]|uniref:tRNA pseudouridine synthase-like 1 isoform X2 n=1 Tax=Stegostoma tigrinum TaxID=3053191 RepID=UPI00202B621F|nr:tRNA pseudouridine synthase-like 1 isoform X2 [Stegostoma tigrinum]